MTALAYARPGPGDATGIDAPPPPPPRPPRPPLRYRMRGHTRRVRRDVTHFVGPLAHTTRLDGFETEIATLDWMVDGGLSTATLFEVDRTALYDQQRVYVRSADWPFD